MKKEKEASKVSCQLQILKVISIRILYPEILKNEMKNINLK